MECWIRNPILHYSSTPTLHFAKAMATATKIEIRDVRHAYQSDALSVLALANVDLTVGDGEFVALLGPSGCGKSSLLRIVADLLRPTGGTVQIHSAANEKNGRPKTALVFQEYALFPWRTVLDNVTFSLEMRGVSRDEPFGALDAQTRTVLQEELLRVWEIERKTVLYVTHSIDEAVFLADRVVLLTARPGRIKAEYPVELPRPRNMEMRAWNSYTKLSLVIWNALRGEVDMAMVSEKP